MNLIHLTKNPSPNRGIDAVVSDVRTAVDEYTNALIERMRTDSASVGEGPELVSKGLELQQKFQELLEKISTLSPHDRSHPVLQVFSKVALAKVRQMDQLLAQQDEMELHYHNASREWRQKKMRYLATARQVFESLAKLRALLIDFLEALDPTPVDYLESEINRIHGTLAYSMISSFKELATSEECSIDAFKQRHNLK